MLIMVLLTQITFAQERTVTGVVTDNSGLPIPGVNVLVKGTTLGIQTDFDGKFSIKATSSQVLVFSFIGMVKKEVKATSTNLNVQLADDSVQLEGVVVTAFGIKKQKKSLGYATSTVTAKDLTEVTNVNLFESLSGTVAGVNITAPAQVGASSKVIIRGYNSLTPGKSSPLYVVDGTPINNSFNGNSGNTRSYDAGNGLNDIDPNNIESMTVLKGAAAAALYGSRASSGVILITTKSAKKNSKMIVELSGSTDWSQVQRTAHKQTNFGQGWNGKSWSNNQPGNTASNENGSWGPVYNGEIRPWGSIIDNAQLIKPYVYLEDSVKDYYEIGSTYTNNVAVRSGGENSSISMNFSNVVSNGVIPTDADLYTRRAFALNGGWNSDKLSFTFNANYVLKDQNAVNTGQGQDAGEGNTMMQELLQIPNDISIVDLADYRSNPFNSNSYYFTPYATNPYWVLNENSTNISGARFFGNANISYALNEHFSASLQVGGDYRPEFVKSYGAIVRFLPGSPQETGGANEIVGGVTEITELNQEVTSNFNINYTGKIGDDWDFNALVGFNYDERSGGFLRASITNLDIPDFYELSNSSVKPVVAQSNYLIRTDAVYASLETGYKDFLFLTLTGRNDWTSTLPQGNNSYFYPSASLSGIVIDNSEYFLKLRAGYAQIGGDTNPYQTQSSMIQGVSQLGFGNILAPIGGVNSYEFAANLGNADLKPEITNEIEIGFETSLFSKRMNIDAAFYNKETTGLLFSRPISPSSGYLSQTSNLLDITNKGVELLVSGNVIQTDDWQWNLTATYTKNLSNIDAIDGGTSKINLAQNFGVSFNAIVDEPLGVFSTFVPVINSAGQYVVNDLGFYKVTEDEQNIGTSQRDFVMGFTSKLSYKNLSLFVGVDWKQGGEMYSYTRRLSEFTGNGITTTFNNRNTFIIPNSVTEVVDGNGVVTGYEENTTPVSMTSQTDFYNTSNNPGIEQTHVIDKTFVRLGSLALTYNVPFKLVERLGLSNAAFSVYGKNLALWTPDGNAYVDPELTTFGDGLLSEQGEFSANPSQSTYGASIKLTF